MYNNFPFNPINPNILPPYHVVLNPYWIFDINIFNIRNYRIIPNLNLNSLSQEDINNRSYIYAVALAHKKLLFESLFQYGNFIDNESVYSNKQYAICLSNIYSDNLIPFGSWYIYNTCEWGTDLIFLYAHINKLDCKTAINQIVRYITNHQEFFGRGNKNAPSWHVQEKYPIHLKSNVVIDTFLQQLVLEQGNNKNIFVLNYNNIDSRLNAILIKFYNYNNELINVFYTYQRHYKSPTLVCVPINPEPPYMLFNIENVKYATEGVVFLDSEKDVEDFGRSSCYDGRIRLACPFGLDHLDQADFSDIPESLPVYIDMPHYRFKDGKLLESYLIRLKNNLKNRRCYIHLYSNCILYNYKYEEINSILTSDIHVIRDSASVVNTFNYIAQSGEKILGADRKRKTILYPIIQSGTINWLFAKEKVGKTWLALTIAYAVGKGNRKVGQWESREPFKVLYIDGEMPADRIQSHCDMIMKGYNDHTGHEHRPFAVYSFYENGLDYDSILDNKWLEEYGKQLYCYDLLILDNYYSINENRIDIKPFMKFLKDISRKGTAIIVLDHTNSEGELQGSIAKRRAADYGIKLDITEDGSINITNQFDRYGHEKQSPDHIVEYVFAGDESFTIQAMPDRQNKKQKDLTDKDKRLLYIYVAHKKFEYQQNNICDILGYGKSTISQYISDVDKQVKDSKDYNIKNKISNLKLFQKKFNELCKVSTEKFKEEFDSNIDFFRKH